MSDKPTLQRRSAGVLLHPTSLPGAHGIGDIGHEAFAFANFLAACGQSWWQMLPIGPVGQGHSPYFSLSAFAGNPLLISLDKLCKKGLLEPADLKPVRGQIRDRVHPASVERFKESRFTKAFEVFDRRNEPAESAAFDAFCQAQKDWLDDYSLYCAIKETHQGAAWTDWEPGLRARHPAALERARQALEGRIRYHRFLQFMFHTQWVELKEYCVSLGLGLIGDIPIFVAADSADVWSHPELFWLGEDGRPSAVAGVPPDYFSQKGQLWGNPLYRWDVMRADGFSWWIARFRSALARFDAVRLDHFIGFHNYWEIPAGAKDATGGRWVQAPGDEFFRAVLRAFGDPRGADGMPGGDASVEIIAEDLGSVTKEVASLRDRFEFPGMRILQFCFGKWDEKALPHNFPRRSVVYTGTHDNDTIVGWFHDPGLQSNVRTPEQVRVERENALKYLDSNGVDIHWDMIRAALKSPAHTAIILAQDLLGLGSEARMNLPGTLEGNWLWRLAPGALTPEIAGRLALMTGAYGRGPRRWTT
ncbi:MAG TPA: 4-alpha-glucanotransferase [Elusimicrobia bacterium]|nr:4-alpha-glucanotransferase [Elusimicrobiota bacterium]HBT63023.1 4-alpha-glucanotransferase [Elusimicrobiota bacterium]